MTPVLFVRGDAKNLRGKARRRARKITDGFEVVNVMRAKRLWGPPRAGNRPRVRYAVKLGWYSQIVCKEPHYVCLYDDRKLGRLNVDNPFVRMILARSEFTGDLFR